MMKRGRRRASRKKVAMLARKMLTGELRAKMSLRRPSYLESEAMIRKGEGKGKMDWSGVFGEAGQKMKVTHRAY